MVDSGLNEVRAAETRPNKLGKIALAIAIFGIAFSLIAMPLLILFASVNQQIVFYLWPIAVLSLVLGVIALLRKNERKTAAIWAIALSILGFGAPFAGAYLVFIISILAYNMGLVR